MFSPFWRSSQNTSAYTDDWEDQPAQGGFYKWGLGVLLPLVFIVYGIRCIILHSGSFPDRVQSIALTGLNANAYGVAVLSLGVFLHCHYFWGNVYDQIWFAVLGKILSAICFIGGLGIVLIRVGILNRH